MGWIVTVLITFLVILIMNIIWTAVWRSKHWKRRGFPHLESPLFIGVSGPTLFLKKSIPENINCLYLKFKSKGFKYGGFMAIQSPVIMIVDTSLAHNVLIKDYSHFQNKTLVNEPQINECFAQLKRIGRIWRYIRLDAVKYFTKSKRKAMFKKIRSCTDDILGFATKNKGELEMRDIAGRFSVNVLGILYNLKIDSHINRKENQLFFDLIERYFHLTPCQLWKMKFVENYPCFARFLTFQDIDFEAREFFLGLVRSMFDTKNYDSFSSTYIQVPLKFLDGEAIGMVMEELSQINEHEPSTSISHLIQSFKSLKEFDNREAFLAAHCYAVFAQGGEVIAQTISFALFEIANRPEIQEALRQEIDDGMKTNGLTFETLSKLTYLEYTIKETLRFHPPFESLNRICVKDYQIPGTNHVIKKGDNVIVPVIGFHSDSEYWDNVEAFNPNRFKGFNTKSQVLYLPYGIGPRQCIGINISVLVMKVFIASVISRYNVKVSSKTKRPYTKAKTSLTNHLEGGMWLELEKRT